MDMHNLMKFSLPFFPVITCATALFAAEAPIPPVPDKQPQPPFAKDAEVTPRLLIPGFTLQELPLKLTSINNLEYAADGRLFAAGYDGRMHLLRDTNGDGLEDESVTFWDKTGPNYPIGMAVKDGEPYVVLTEEIVRFRDTNADGVPDQREALYKGFDDPAMVTAPYLNHRRVDSSLAIAFGPDGACYVGMGNAGYNNPYWQDKFVKGRDGEKPSGTPHYTPQQRRGCLLRFDKEGKTKQLASGLRYIMSLQFNRHGDLFGTDQEGATWCPNGNPWDELVHIQTGRHYGFPPSHPKFLPNVVDEPSVWDYAPQHESTCGFRFNGPQTARGRLGPAFWAEDALVTGESRGVLYRTKLAKTAAGYVARNELFARLNLLAVDCAISPKGDMLIACHTGKPDWGNGPQGAGRIFKLSFTDPSEPQPVLTYAASETETVIIFDQPLPTEAAPVAAQTTIIGGRYAAAGDRFETMRPGYKVVSMQQSQPITKVAVQAVKRSGDGRSLTITSVPRQQSLTYALAIKESLKTPLDLAHGLEGLQAEWHGGETSWQGWLPHADLTAAREFTNGSASHDALWKHLETSGKLTLKAQLDLWNLLQPATQPLSELDYAPDPENVTITFKSNAAVTIDAPGAKITRVSDQESQLNIPQVRQDRWQPLTITLASPARTLDISYVTKRDAHQRPLGTRRFQLPFAKPAPPDKFDRNVPELAGGNWAKGQELYMGKAACFTCHTFRNQGSAVGPDLNNQMHRDYASVLRDIVDPNAVLNPDAIGYTVTLKNGETITGTRVAETSGSLTIAQPGGQTRQLDNKEISKTETLAVSLMPAGLEKILTPEELRDLMTYLLREAPKH